MTTRPGKGATATTEAKKNRTGSPRRKSSSQTSWPMSERSGAAGRVSDREMRAEPSDRVSRVKVMVGGTIEDDAADFLDAWHGAEHGEQVKPECVLAFESWDGIAAVLSGERFRMLRHLRRHPEPSVSALARSLGRRYSRVHADVAALAAAGLIDRSGGKLRAAADRITAEILL